MLGWKEIFKEAQEVALSGRVSLIKEIELEKIHDETIELYGSMRDIHILVTAYMSQTYGIESQISEPLEVEKNPLVEFKW